MTEREEQAIIVLNTLHDNPLLSDIHRQALEVGIMAIRALQLQPCENAIGRQAVLDEMYKRKENGDAITAGFIKNLPSVKPVEKIGHWIETKKSWMLYKWECSECKTSERFKYNYCPSCGSRMIQEDER